jgi:hypothetical protein
MNFRIGHAALHLRGIRRRQQGDLANIVEDGIGLLAMFSLIALLYQTQQEEAGGRRGNGRGDPDVFWPSLLHCWGVLVLAGEISMESNTLLR